MIDVQRPKEVPSSLQRGKHYGRKDVREALYATFLGKCYLCETPIMLGTFEVDHRKPQAEFPSEVYVWENLFPACAEFDCNNRRPREKYPQGGLLSPGEGVEQRLVQRIERTVSPSLRSSGYADIVFEAVDGQDVSAQNTACELDRIHNATGSSAVAKADCLRRGILERIVAIAPEIYEYERLIRESPPESELVSRQRKLVSALVSRRAPYAMLVRNYFGKIDSVRALYD